MFNKLKLRLKSIGHRRKLFWQGIAKTIFLQIVFFIFFFMLEKILSIEPINFSQSLVFIIFGFLFFLFLLMSFFSFKELSYSHVFQGKIRNRGLYAFSRHPFYGAIVFLLNPSIALILKSWGLFCACFVSYFIWKMQADHEEERLVEKFDKVYKNYQMKVPRMFFPKIFESAYSKKKALFYILIAATSFFLVVVSFNLYINISSRTVSFNENIGPEVTPAATSAIPQVTLTPIPTTASIPTLVSTPTPTPNPIPTVETSIVPTIKPTPTIISTPSSTPEVTDQTIAKPPFSIESFWQNNGITTSYILLVISFLGLIIFGYLYFFKRRGKNLSKKVLLSLFIISVFLFVLGAGFYIISKVFFSERVFGNIPIPSVEITPPTILIPIPTSIAPIAPPNLFEINSEGIYAKLSGNISIPKIGVSAPVIFVGDYKWVDYDHRYGVVHYPETVFPGNVGAALLSGHSSAPRNLNSPYGKIFSRLNDLGPNDEVIIVFQGSTYNYRIFSKEIVAPKDFRLREYQGKETITLLSCWPVGTDARRIIIEAERIK